MSDPTQRRLHCEVAKLREREFPQQDIERTIRDLLEVIAYFIGGTSLEEQLRLFQFAEQTMMRNRNEVLRGTYKRASTPERAN